MQTLIVGIDAAYDARDMHHTIEDEVLLARDRGDVIATFRMDSNVCESVINACGKYKCVTNVEEPERRVSSKRKTKVVDESQNVVVIVPDRSYKPHEVMIYCDEIGKRYKLRAVKAWVKGAKV